MDAPLLPRAFDIDPGTLSLAALKAAVTLQTCASRAANSNP
jgi:hypothetical protein